MANALAFPTAAPRSVRRAISRDQARATARYGTPGHATGGSPVYRRRAKRRLAGTTSGQARINRKRNERAAFWVEYHRTVRVVVSAEVEPYFRQYLHLLGEGSRIDDSRSDPLGFWLDLNVHIPDAPANAVRAQPVYRSVQHGDHHIPVLDHVEWIDADGQHVR